jgi:hypothetical protein
MERNAPGIRPVMRRAGIVIALAAFAGCGGSDELLTHDEFVAKADAICAEYNAKFEDALGSLSQDATDDERNGALEEYARAYGDMTDDVTGLEPPEDDGTIARFLDRLKRNARGFDEAADKGELMSDSTGDAAFNSLREASALAEEAGLDECSMANG